ncbi:hypothetical protein HPP92_002569 [Vanilla planifolia]|uniref:Uncharacterized protein n=1 Tax=Vanilla planifolia TaxID=51239 RepID=A0A835RW46_VANPL|nr:hypothetical protein HPP92_002569 [Vanilla planifolia]
MAPPEENNGEMPSAEEVVDDAAGSEAATRKPISTVVMVICECASTDYVIFSDRLIDNLDSALIGALLFRLFYCSDADGGSPPRQQVAALGRPRWIIVLVAPKEVVIFSLAFSLEEWFLEPWPMSSARRRYISNEDEYGFRRPRRLVYYEDESGLEKARQTLNWKIRQLNFAIDRVSSRLRGEKEMPDPESIEADSGFGATL